MNTSRLAVPANTSGGSSRRVSASRILVGNAVSEIIRSRPLRLAALLAATAFPNAATALNVAWNPNPEADIAGYQLSYGTSSGSHTNLIDAGLNTSVAVSGLQEGTTYYFVVTATNRSGLTSVKSAEVSHQVTVAPPPPPPPGDTLVVIPRTGWALQSASSQETTGENGAATNAFDGNPATFWHTAWSVGDVPPPHEIRIDLGSTRLIRGFRYLPRQDGVPNGNIGQYEFYVSTDGTNWGNPVAVGTFPNSSSEKEVLFTEKTGRYVRLRSLSDASGEIYCSIAELNILGGSTSTPINQPPVAAAKSVTTAEDAAVGITLTASDPEGGTLTYAVTGGPAKGILSGTPPNLTYKPNADFNGADSFTFQASDGNLTSNTASVSITVTPVNDAPVAVAKSATTAAGTPVAITLSASDKDSPSLTFAIVTPPAGGALSGNAPNLTYTPAAGFSGADSFTYRASDGSANSNTATVSITVTAVVPPPPPPGGVVNNPPVFTVNPVTRSNGSENTPYNGTIAGSATDPDTGDAITYSKTSGPAWLVIAPDGSLSGTPPAGSSGLNSFGIRAADKAGATASAVLNLQIGSSALTAPWEMTSLGSGGPANRASSQADVFSLEGLGVLGGISDSGCFVSQVLSGDGEITVRLVSHTNTLKSALAGIMIRDSLTPNAKHVFAGLNGQGGLCLVRRSWTGGLTSASTATGAGAPPNAWLRLVRKGRTVYAYASADGTVWNRFGSLTTSFGSQCRIGLFQAGGSGTLGAATLSVSSVTP